MQTQAQQKQDQISRDFFLSQVQQLKDSNSLTPGKIAELQPDSKLNLVFDIDHTLIFAIDKRLYPKLVEEHGKEWGDNIHKLELSPADGSWTHEMWLIVRYGVVEMLDYLSTFCTFYVYSHGFATYVTEILKKIDPEEKYFKDRDRTVIAPKDQAEQGRMTTLHKQLLDFRDPNDRSKPLFSRSDLDKTLIIDDQYMAIHDKSHLVISKKFLKFAGDAPGATTAKQAHWNNYQYPPTADRPELILRGDLTKAHQELNNPGEPNQLYYIGNLITRCYLARTLLSPESSIPGIMQEFRASIFKGQKFFFEDFLSVGLPLQTMLTSPELASAVQMRQACEAIVKELGGVVTQTRLVANYVVLFQNEAARERLLKYREEQKVVNFKYLTECYFQMLRLKLDSKTEDDFKMGFLVKRK